MTQNNDISDEIYVNYAVTNENNQPVHEREPITIQPGHLQGRILNDFVYMPVNVEEFQMNNLHTDNFPGARRPIPVSTIDWRSTERSQFIPIHGLDFLIGVTSVLIQQSVELADLMTRIESEGRYILKVPGGETLYLAGESSTSLQRLFCGSRRGCAISLNDHTRQEALLLKRRLAMSSCCFPCKLQEMQVIAPPGDYLGRVHQQWTLSIPFFLIKNQNEDLLYVIEGPSMNNICGKLDAEFKIISGDSLIEQGSILHRWEPQLSNYAMTVNFPSMAAEPKIKALIIGAAFLLEYTYFARGKSTKCSSYLC